MSGRDIPTDVKEHLRKEVNNACPIEGCGSPYLTWHHFDPPFAEANSHEPDGMIAMCLEHHKRADSGAYTNAELRELKSNPFSANLEKVEGYFDWRHKDLLLLAGGACYENVGVILDMDGCSLLSVAAGEAGRKSINLDIRDTSGDQLFLMKQNNWEIYPDLKDIDCPPSARRLYLRYRPREPILDLKFVRSGDKNLVKTLTAHYRQVDNKRRVAESRGTFGIRIIGEVSSGTPEQRAACESARIVKEYGGDLVICIIKLLRFEWPRPACFEHGFFQTASNNPAVKGDIQVFCDRLDNHSAAIRSTGGMFVYGINEPRRN